MKRIIFVSLVLMAVVCGSVEAKDVLIDAQITDIVTKLDKNGGEYMRISIPDARELNGVKYSVPVTVMVGKENLKAASTLKAGDTLRAIAEHKVYKGRVSYSLIKILPQEI